VQIQRTDGQWYWAEYSTFSVSDEVGKYRLTVDGYSGDAGDAMTAEPYPSLNGNGMKFSTPDSDNDAWSGGHCRGDGGWWFKWYSTSWLNLWFNWCPTSWLNLDGMAIWTTGAAVSNVQASRMLIKVGGMIS